MGEAEVSTGTDDGRRRPVTATTRTVIPNHALDHEAAEHQAAERRAPAQHARTIRVLGPPDVISADAAPVAFGGPTQRRVLAVLVANLGRPVSVGDLSASLWPTQKRPRDPSATVYTCVARLRRALDTDLIQTRSGAYVLAETSRITIDVTRFEALLEQARQAVSPSSGLPLWAELVGLWRGAAFDGDEHLDAVRREAERLNELRAEAIESWLLARLMTAHPRHVVADLDHAIDQFPLREGLRTQQLTALALSGRRIDALRAFQQFRADLAEIGLEPSAQLRDLDHRIASGVDLEPRQSVGGQRYAGARPNGHTRVGAR